MRRCLLTAAALAAPGILQAQEPARIREAEQVLVELVQSYGVSGSEAPVREAVRRLLPSWARPEVDTAGNLWLTLGEGDPVVVFVAHLDEVGFRITAVRDDGQLEITPVGGIMPWLWQGRPALVHAGDSVVPGVFHPDTTLVDVGSSSRAATEARGIRTGHTVTMRKRYARLAGTRATGRSFDDRVGSAALILAARRLVPSRLTHTVVLLWSVREEIGFEGAVAAAHALGLRTARVHAVDTFVSADSPLERATFGLAPLGAGPVARALDNSAVTPPAYLDSLKAVARRNRVPLQVGATNGGNDGSAFSEYGVPDVAIGWPLRYSHSPAEVADLRDVAHLADLVRTLAAEW